MSLPIAERMGRIAGEMAIAATLSGYRVGSVNVFVGRYNFPKIGVERVSEDLFNVYVFKSFTEMLSDMLGMGDEDKAYGCYRDVFFDSFWNSRAFFRENYKNGKREISDWFKKHPSEVRGHLIEHVIKGKKPYLDKHPEYFSMTGTVNKAKASKLMYKHLKCPLNNFERMYGEVDFSDGEVATQFNYGKWNVIMDDGAADRGRIEKFLDKVSSRLGRFRVLCYGRLEVKRTLMKRALADYSPGADTMRIKTNRNSGDLFFISFVHELGHRLHHKFMSEEQRKAVSEKYNDMISGVSSLEKGDLVELGNGYSFKMLRNMGKSRYRAVTVGVGSDPSVKRPIAPGDEVIFTMIPGMVTRVNGKDFDRKLVKFPTTYAKTNENEFFAECFVHWIVGDLGNELKEWLEELLK